MEIRRFFIVGEQRSGTIAIGDLLNSHPDIIVFGELFLNFPAKDNPHSYFEFVASNIDDGISRFYPNFDYVRKNLTSFFDNLHLIDEKHTFGFHLKYDQISYIPELLKHLKELDFSCIHVIRPNILDVLLSQITLEYRHKNKLPSHTGIDSNENLEISVDLPDISELITRARAIEDRVNSHRDILAKSFSENYLEIVYPQMLSREGRFGYGATLEWLGVQNSNLTSSIKKSSTANKILYSDEKIIENVELRSIIIDT